MSKSGLHKPTQYRYMFLASLARMVRDRERSGSAELFVPVDDIRDETGRRLQDETPAQGRASDAVDYLVRRGYAAAGQNADGKPTLSITDFGREVSLHPSGTV